MFLLYNLLLLLTSPIWGIWAFVRARRRQEAPNWAQRMGDYRSVAIEKGKPALWIHAVSVGEVLAALPILKQVRALMPNHHIVLSVTTSSGHRTASEYAVDLYDSLVYFPIDVARWQLSAMMRVKPDVVAVMETELWFNFLWAAKAIGAQTFLINGRISDRSFERSRPFRFFYRAMLRNLDHARMQTSSDAERIRELGAQDVAVFGNSKFDEAIDGLDADVDWWRESLGVDLDVPVVVVGSSRGEEEEAFIRQALARVEREFSLIWAPRHLERADPLFVDLRNQFGEVARRSRAERGSVVLLDTYGELSRSYSVADVVIVGGGFVPLGGQNLLQPLAHGKPVLHGPHMDNFRLVADQAALVGATVVCSTPEALARELDQLLSDAGRRERMGRAGRDFVAAHAGASRRYADAIAAAEASSV